MRNEYLSANDKPHHIKTNTQRQIDTRGDINITKIKYGQP